MSSIIPYTCQDSKKNGISGGKTGNFGFVQCFAPAKRIPFGAFFGCADAGLPVRGGRGGKVQPIDGGTASGVYWTCVKMHEWPSALRRQTITKTGSGGEEVRHETNLEQQIFGTRLGQGCGCFTMAMVLAVGGLGRP